MAEVPISRAGLPDRDRPLRVLIVRIGAMGDVLHAMPAVAALRERYPGVFLAWAIEPRWSELLQAAGERAPGETSTALSETKPLVDVWYPVATKRWQRRPLSGSTIAEIRDLWRELRSCRFDVCVDLQGSIKSAVVGRISGSNLFAGPADPRERQAKWFYRSAVSARNEHVVEQACEVLGAAVGAALGERFEPPLQPVPVTLPRDEAGERWCDAALAEVCPAGERFVLIAPAAGWGAKQWSAERFGAVAAELAAAGFRVVVNAASFGDAVSLGVVEASGDAARLIPCSLGQLIALVRRAALVIAGDTGPLHLAAALRRPVVGLFGPTDPARNGPYGTRSVTLRHPSSRVDHTRSPQTEAGLQQIKVAEVVEAALRLLQGEQDKLDP